MDLITIIWYVATLIALISFFVVMACADTSRCFTQKPQDVETPVPPTPAPSYRLFAPPSYEAVIEKRPESIFIIPIHNSSREQLTEDLVINLSNVLEPTVMSRANLRSERIDTCNRSQRSENLLSVTVWDSTWMELIRKHPSFLSQESWRHLREIRWVRFSYRMFAAVWNIDLNGLCSKWHVSQYESQFICTMRHAQSRTNTLIEYDWNYLAAITNENWLLRNWLQ